MQLRDQTWLATGDKPVEDVKIDGVAAHPVRGAPQVDQPASPLVASSSHVEPTSQSMGPLAHKGMSSPAPETPPWGGGPVYIVGDEGPGALHEEGAHCEDGQRAGASALGAGIQRGATSQEDMDGDSKHVYIYLRRRWLVFIALALEAPAV